MSRGGKVLEAARRRSALCVKHLGVPVLGAVDADRQASVALQVGMEGPLNEPSELGVRVPGVRKEWRDVEVAARVRCRSGAFL